MQALASFYFKYRGLPDSESPTEVWVIYLNGFLEITGEHVVWETFDNHYANPKDAMGLITYMRQTANWVEFCL